MKYFILTIILLLYGCVNSKDYKYINSYDSDTQQPCKWQLNEKEEYIEICR